MLSTKKNLSFKDRYHLERNGRSIPSRWNKEANRLALLIEEKNNFKLKLINKTMNGTSF